MKCRILQTTEVPKDFWSVCLFSVIILKIPKHLPSPSEKEQDPSMYNCVSVLYKASSQISVGWQLLVVPVQLNSCWAVRESSGNSTGSGTPTCQPSAPGTHPSCSLAPLQAGSILVLGTDLLDFSHLLSARALSNCISAAEDRLGCWAKLCTLQVLGGQPDNFRDNFHSFR